MPRLVVLTDRRRSAGAGRPLADTVAAVVDAGAPAILLREKDLPPPRRARLAEQVAAPVVAAGAVLLVASDARLASAVGADGVHLAAADPAPAARTGLTGRSTHTAAEVRGARRERLDYVTCSPVAPTASKPGHGPPLGMDGLAALVVAADPLPVLGLGGVTVAHVPGALAAGAYGVAVMGSVMGADDPAAVVAGLLVALGRDPGDRPHP